MRFIIRQTVVADMELDSLEQAVEWVESHTVLDLPGRNATRCGAQILDYDTCDMLYDGDA